MRCSHQLGEVGAIHPTRVKKEEILLILKLLEVVIRT